MRCDILSLVNDRQVTICGTNVYTNPEYHPDRIMEEHDLMYVCQGEWQIVQDNICHHIRAGDMLLLHAGGHHFAPVPCSANAKNLFIHFTASPEDRINVDLPSAEVSSYAIGSQVCLPPVINCGTRNEIESLMLSVIDAYWSHRDDQQRRMTMLLNLLLAELSFIARKSPQVETTETWIFTLLAAMRAQPDHFFSLEEAAALVHMQVRTLSSHFRTIMGKSVHQYQLDTKLQMAYNSLTTNTYTVKQVSDMYGFCDPYYFSRVFKKKFGIAPKEIKLQNPAANIGRPWMR